MRTTKRELNQHTAQVLDLVGDDNDVVITERGEPRWRVSRYREADTGLKQLERLGRYTPPSSTPSPWPEHPGGPAYTDSDLTALLDELKGDH